MVRGLTAAQIPVWVDKQRLSAGENYERSLEFAWPLIPECAQHDSYPLGHTQVQRVPGFAAILVLLRLVSLR